MKCVVEVCMIRIGANTTCPSPSRWVVSRFRPCSQAAATSICIRTSRGRNMCSHDCFAELYASTRLEDYELRR